MVNKMQYKDKPTEEEILLVKTMQDEGYVKTSEHAEEVLKSEWS